MNPQIPFTPPTLNADGFNCPSCNAFSQQDWGTPNVVVATTNYGASDTFKIARCRRCAKLSVWIDGKMVHPVVRSAPLPNPDLSDDTKKDYDEARSILTESPRGAAALLRLAIQKICAELGEKGENINADIASLVKKGLPAKVQQSLDTVRVVGNNAVHPGQIDLRDNTDIAVQLFSLVNLIAEVMISQPKHVEELYASVVPDAQRKAIDKRDGSA